MPIINTDDYKPPFWLPDGQSQTVFPSLFRKVEGINYVRERIKTDDGDFLDLDFSRCNSTTLQFNNSIIILSHGLEGDSSRQYITGMVKNFNNNGFDCLAWNFRSCSGELNQTKRFYHSGATNDLETIVKHSLLKGYKKIYLVGFSLGGNLTLKYLGEKRQNLYPEIQKAVTFSVPLHLSSSSKKIGWLYTKRFNKSLIKKILAKSQRFPEFNIDTSNIAKIKTLKDFDDIYTSQLHGFIDAEDYYERSSSLYFLDKINIPTLIINAQNDPFLSTECFPFEQVKQVEKVYFQAPKMGGHCGFYPDDYQGILWSEKRALAWILNEQQ
jgi:predicted alpha/beta-fold hydrolase